MVKPSVENQIAGLRRSDLHKGPCIWGPGFLFLTSHISRGRAFFEIVIFLIFKMTTIHHIGFLKSFNFIGWWHLEGRDASSCQNSSTLVNPLQRYHDFFILQDGGRPPSWICLGLIWSSLYPFAKFSCDRCSILRTFQHLACLAWKLIHTPKNCFCIWPPKWGAVSMNSPKARLCVSRRRLSHQTWKFVEQSHLEVSSQRGYKYKWLYFTHLHRSPLTDLLQIWCNGGGRQRDHLWQFLRSVKEESILWVESIISIVYHCIICIYLNFEAKLLYREVHHVIS